MKTKNHKSVALMGVAALLFLAIGSAQASLIAYWNMDEASGNIVDQVDGIVGTASADGLTYGEASVPAGTYGSITISASVSSYFGQAIAFSRADGGSFSIPAATSILNLTPGGSNGSFTLMAWVNASVAPASNHRIFSTGPPNGWGVGLSNVDQVLFTGFGIVDVRSSNAPSSNNQWQHLAYTYDNGNLEVFINGDSVFTGSTAINAPTVSEFGIGSNSSGGDHFNGLIDELKIFDSVLSRDDIITQASIPEPSSALLLLPAAMIFLHRRRR